MDDRGAELYRRSRLWGLQTKIAARALLGKRILARASDLRIPAHGNVQFVPLVSITMVRREGRGTLSAKPPSHGMLGRPDRPRQKLVHADAATCAKHLLAVAIACGFVFRLRSFEFRIGRMSPPSLLPPTPFGDQKSVGATACNLHDFEYHLSFPQSGGWN